MKQSTFYLLLCVVGVIAPWVFLLGFLDHPQASIPLFFTSIFVNSITSAVAADLIVSSVVFFVFVFFEGKRLDMKKLWLFIPATLCVGLSFGLPLFLYFRAKKLRDNTGAGN